MKQGKGEEVFSAFFSQVYGERWPELKGLLLAAGTKVARANAFYEEDRPKGHGVLQACEQGGLKDCYHVDSEFDLKNYSTLMMPYYRMDPASIFPPLMLAPKPGESVLDMCAAPGGKTLVLAEQMFYSQKSAWSASSEEGVELEGVLVANELSPKRRFRMMSVMKNYLPQAVRKRVKIRGVDGSKMGLERKEAFDRILLDAPCSGERELMHKSKGLSDWKEKRSKNFGIRQYSLLASAFMSLKPGGTLVYSTCSISPHENDAVIEKLHKRKSGEFSVERSSWGVGEPTEHGQIILPFEEGWGPIYFACIKKN